MRCVARIRRARLLDDPAGAWSPYEPTDSEPWDLSRVAHLHRRAGFSAPWATLQRDLGEGPEPSIGRLLDGEPTSLDGMPAGDFGRFQDAMASRVSTGGDIKRLREAWLYRMIFTPHPLQERMTLFWHDHFATSNAKVNSPTLMRRQNELLRRHALGDFRSLLRAIAKDPAMLLWLDSASNRKAHPNENYAREVMELFSLGRGRYTEKDIQEAARAFTGSFVQGDRFVIRGDQHDQGAKTILGRTGRFDGDEVAEILLEQEATGEFLARKLYRLFISEVDEPSEELLAPLADSIRSSGYNMAEPIGLILRSRIFHDPASRRRRVKSPIELAIGTIRALEVTDPTVSIEALAESCQRMGQSLFEPPSVAGWDGGPAWINTTTSLARTNLALGLLSDSDDRFGKRLDPAELARRHGVSGASGLTRFYRELLVQDALDPEAVGRVMAAVDARTDLRAAAREAASLVLSSPEYQLA